MCRYAGNVPVSVGSPLRPELLDPLMGVTAPGFPDLGKLRGLSADTPAFLGPVSLQVSNISVFAIVTPNLEFLLSRDGSYHSH